MLTVKQYADQSKKTVQSVYKQLKSKKNKDRLQGKIIKENGTTYLTQAAIDILNESRATPTVIIEANNTAKMKALEEENKQLLIKIAELQDKLLEHNAEYKQLVMNANERFQSDQSKIRKLENKLEQQQEEIDSFYPSLFGFYRKK